MPLPSSGTITMAQINAEFGRGNNLNSYRGTTYYTSSGGPFTFSSGAISFSNFYGTQATSPTFSFTISSNVDQANLRTLAVNAGWNQSSPVVATLANGVWIYSSSTGVAALTIDGSWPGGVTFINNYYVAGMGGNGGQGAATLATGLGGGGGGPALSLGAYVTIYNYGYIAGGGGGGGGGGSANPATSQYGTFGSGGGGGGAGGTGLGTSLGGGVGAAYYPGTAGSNNYANSSGAGGGAGGGSSPQFGGAGGSGGGWGSAGNGGASGSGGAASNLAGGAGGAAGYCTIGNGYITWAVTGNRLGPLG